MIASFLSLNTSLLTQISPHSLLKLKFGFDDFLPLQERIISDVVSGSDALVLMPTGAGKSLCYQLPALMMNGYTMVVSPLISLMKDQVDTLNANGIPAAFTNSTLTASQNEQVLSSAVSGNLKIIYVAPERIATARFQRFLMSTPPSLIAIDEAHCISEWGHDFRPDYRNLRALRKNLPSVPLIALTATATLEVRKDIAGQLGIPESNWHVSSFNRPNLSYSVRPKAQVFDQLVGLLDERKGQSSIVYCFSRKETEELASDLEHNGISAAAYHAGLETSVRRSTQEKFIRDEVDVIVATIAFGMGIDKPNVRLVVHYSLSKSLEGYYQETGRAGRDGLPSECVLFYSYGDRVKQDFFVNQIEDPQERENASTKLSAMVEYGETSTCRRKFMLEYFGDTLAPSNSGCGGCDVCVGEKETFDATEISQKILSAIVRTGERFGAKYVLDVLRGSKAKRILEQGHDQLSVHGIATDHSEADLRELVALLTESGHIAVSSGEYRTLAVTSIGRTFLRNRESLTLSRAVSNPISSHEIGPKSGSNGKDLAYDKELFNELKKLRKRAADQRDVPSFVIFGDVSLREMAYYMPHNSEEFGRITGVGSRKLERFGDEFVELIVRYCERTGVSPNPLSGSVQPRRSRTRTKPRNRGLSRSLTETKRLFQDGFGIEEIALERGYSARTISSHLERIGRIEPDFNIDSLLPAPERIVLIENELRKNEDGLLTPVKQALGEDVSYEDIKFVRLKMEREQKLTPGRA